MPLPAHGVEEVRAAYTVRQELVERLRAGAGAEWLHDVGLGVPGARLVSWGVWSPFHLPGWILPFDVAWTLGVGLRLLVALAGGWALARHFRGGTLAAAAAGVSAIVVVAALGLATPRADAFALTPALLVVVGGLMRRDAHWWQGLPLVLVATGVWLAGSPTAAMLACAAALPVVAAHLWRRRSEGWRLLRPVAAVVGGVTLALGLAGFTLLPSAELLRDPATRAVVRSAQALPDGPLAPPSLTALSERDLLPRPPDTARLAAASVRGRVGTTAAVVPPHTGLPWGVAVLTPEALADRRGQDVLDRVAPDRRRGGDVDWTDFDRGDARVWAAALGVHAVLRPTPDGARIVEVRPALPTVLLTAGALPASAGGALDAVRRSGVEGLILRTVVEPYENQQLGRLPDGGGGVRLASSSRAGGHVRALVQSERGGVLVSLDRALPGWESHIGGRPDTVLRANALFVGVPVPPGTHLVELRYEPPRAVLGVVTSMRALGGVLGWLLLRWLRERTRMSTWQLLLAAAHEGQRRWIHRRAG